MKVWVNINDLSYTRLPGGKDTRYHKGKLDEIKDRKSMW